MKKCPACSEENEDEFKHCTNCGKDIRLVPAQKLTPAQKGDYWSASSQQKSSSEQVAPDTRRYVIQQYNQYMYQQRVYVPIYRVKYQNIYYVVRSQGFKYKCPKCGYEWHPTTQNPVACPGPGCHVKFGWKVRMGVDLRPWFIPIAASVEISR